MRKMVKMLGILISCILVVVIIGIVAVTALIDPNDFKPQISQKVYEKTGRSLNITGKIHWQFFPRLGLELNEVSLSNRPGFNPPAFFQVKQAAISVEFWPLLKKQVNIEGISLNGLQLYLANNAQGESNWSDLLALAAAPTTANKNAAMPKQDSTASVTTQSRKPLKFAIANIKVKNSSLTWQDAQNQRSFSINNLQITSNNINQRHPFSFTIQGDLTSSKPQLNTQFKLDGNVNLQLAPQSYLLTNFKLVGTLLDARYPQGQLPFYLKTNLTWIPDQDLVTIKQVDTGLANLKASGDLQLQHIRVSPILQGDIQIPNFNPKQLLQALGKSSSVAGLKADILQAFSARFTVSLAPNLVRLDKLNAHLDDSTLTGTLAVTDFTAKTITFNLALDQLNLDRYLANNKNASTQTSDFLIKNVYAVKKPIKSATINSSWQSLREINFLGNLKINKLHIAQLDIRDISAQTRARQGLIIIDPLQAKIYQGNYTGDIAFDVRTNTPKFSTHSKLINIQAQPLFRDLTNITRIQLTGTGTLLVNLTTQGGGIDAWLKQLQGDGRLTLTQGVLHGIDIPYWIEFGKAIINKETPPASSAAAQTDFGNLSGTFTVNQGILSNNDLLLMSSNIQVNGHGTANLPQQWLNYQLTIQPLNPGTRKPQGFAVPLKISGAFTKPFIQPDVEEILKQQIQQQITKQKDKLQQKVNETVDKYLGKDLGDQLQKQLNINKLFGQ